MVFVSEVRRDLGVLSFCPTRRSVRLFIPLFGSIRADLSFGGSRSQPVPRAIAILWSIILSHGLVGQLSGALHRYVGDAVQRGIIGFDTHIHHVNRGNAAAAAAENLDGNSSGSSHALRCSLHSEVDSNDKT